MYNALNWFSKKSFLRWPQNTFAPWPCECTSFCLINKEWNTKNYFLCYFKNIVFDQFGKEFCKSGYFRVDRDKIGPKMFQLNKSHLLIYCGHGINLASLLCPVTTWGVFQWANLDIIFAISVLLHLWIN